MRRIVLAAAVVVAACASPPTASPYSVETWTTGLTCLGGLISPGGPPLALHGRLVDGAAEIWAGDTHPVLWPSGYYATFEPDLVIHDEAGAVRGRDGEDMGARPADWHGQTICWIGGPSGPMDAPDSVVQVQPKPSG